MYSKHRVEQARRQAMAGTGGMSGGAAEVGAHCEGRLRWSLIQVRPGVLRWWRAIARASLTLRDRPARPCCYRSIGALCPDGPCLRRRGESIIIRRKYQIIYKDAESFIALTERSETKNALKSPFLYEERFYSSTGSLSGRGLIPKRPGYFICNLSVLKNAGLDFSVHAPD
jgi:hypothetical protein